MQASKMASSVLFAALAFGLQGEVDHHDAFFLTMPMRRTNR